MPTYNVNQIYLGKFAEFDTVESNYTNEKTTVEGWESGRVFTGNDMRVIQITQNDTVQAYDGVVHSNTLEEDDRESFQDSVTADSYTYNLGLDSETSKIDSSFAWSVTIKWGDGSTEDITLSFLQLQNGDVFIHPGDTYFDNKNIQSITLNSFISSNFFGFDANHSVDKTKIVCFATDTRIMTAGGERNIEELACGDQIMTVDNGLQPIRWIGSCRISSAELNAFPQLRPIRIHAKSLSALGEGKPFRDLMVSPQHRILVRSKIAQRMFGTDEVLVAAKHLLECDGFEIAEDVTEVEYFHMLFDRHEVIYSNGVETESLHTGPQALKSVGPAAREEIFTLFPELRDCDPTATRPLARPALSGREGRNFAMRSKKNKQPLLGP